MPKRRKLPNGVGSITKIPTNSNGKTRAKPYRARLPATYDQEGNEKRKILGHYKTYNEALEALVTYKEKQDKEKSEIERLKKELAKEKAKNKKDPTTFKDLYLTYTNTKKYKDLSRNTHLRYERSFERLQPLHDLPITEITYSQIQEIFDQIETEGRERTNHKGETIHEEYSKSALERLKTVVNKVYTLAIRNGIKVQNLAPYIEIGGAKEKRVKEIFTSDEIKALFKSMPQNPDARHILVMCFTGMRTGEYLGLTTDKIHLDENTIKDFGEKTEAGRTRTMYIHPKIKPILADLIKESNTGQIVEYHGKKLANDTLFYRQVYYPALDKAGIKRKIPYSCRYTFATIAYYSGVNEKAIQKLMGHTDLKITQEFYIQDKENMAEFLFDELKKI